MLEQWDVRFHIAWSCNLKPIKPFDKRCRLHQQPEYVIDLLFIVQKLFHTSKVKMTSLSRSFSQGTCLWQTQIHSIIRSLWGHCEEWEVIVNHSFEKLLLWSNVLFYWSNVKDIINPWNCFLKNANFSIKTSNE